MSEFKGTKGVWYVERTSDQNTDYQARILSNIGKIFHAGQEKEQIMIIVGEPKKINGQSNIHVEANAKLIAAAPEILEKHEEELFLLEKVAKQLDELEGYLWGDLIELINEKRQLIKKATEL